MKQPSLFKSFRISRITNLTSKPRFLLLSTECATVRIQLDNCGSEEEELYLHDNNSWISSPVEVWIRTMVVDTDAEHFDRIRTHHVRSTHDTHHLWHVWASLMLLTHVERLRKRTHKRSLHSIASSYIKLAPTKPNSKLGIFPIKDVTQNTGKHLNAPPGFIWERWRKPHSKVDVGGVPHSNRRHSYLWLLTTASCNHTIKHHRQIFYPIQRAKLHCLLHWSVFSLSGITLWGHSEVTDVIHLII